MKKSSPRKPAPKTAKATRTAQPASRSPRRVNPALQLLRSVVQALDGKKAGELQVLDVSKQSSITDYLVLGTATSDPHLRALRIELEKVLDAARARILGMDGAQGSGWIVVDAFEIMVHLFTAENRGKYRMDLLWRDATEVSLDKLLKK